MMLILVCGSRTWQDEPMIARALREVAGSADDVTLITGGARGADDIAERVGHGLGWTVITVPADWQTYGKAAGPRRNQEMLSRGPDIVVAFATPCLAKSRGTADMVRRAWKAQVNTIVYEVP